MLIFALLNVNQNKLTDVIKKIQNLGTKVNKVHLVYGEYDIIAELKAYNPENSAKVLKEIRETDGVNSMKTYVVSDQINDDFEPGLLQESW
ncbi:Lrp/AsnC family transcriptional regulator [Candidatus Woesearchaeota archaeon]|nr:Lrp/AsnC family transcriptional regulator [Candidatus Woesearchaeota archaeon]